ncbi:urea ABC transporter permease subunit UrtB [Desulfofundulus salinus]|uniref:Urea ABC transporter permease subunit UrtB n=1 Tax=Desulfofundulus salinus TaxID=2419843 RepID=A0A494WVA4_9FIRM|nr:urea ABC transporter permease subunit UrtB [Desulfofundulus salinum]RKO66102.1 urea ABC transporter permease subunit UrtB [Desulfofundulus salinum]
MDVWLLQIFNSLSVSSILLLIALGLAITFGLMNVINMAHGELIMIGAYVTYVVQIVFARYAVRSFELYYLVAIPISFLVAAFVGFLLERGLIRFLYGRPLDTLLATWGISLILQQIARDIFGAPNVEVSTPHWLKGGLELLDGLQLPYNRIFIIVLAIVCLISIYFYMYRSASGCKMRAVVQNRAMAACLGIPTSKVDAYTFAIGSGLAGVAGCALCLLGPIGPSIGTYYIVDAFMVVVLGGVGKLIGTFAAAVVIGVLNTTFEFGSTATMGKVLALLMVMAFLQWRPSGLVSLKVRTLD